MDRAVGPEKSSRWRGEAGCARTMQVTPTKPDAIEKTQEPRVLNRIVPPTPDLAIRIMPDLKLDNGKADFTFANFRCRTRNLGRQEVIELNRLIVRCAEDSVFYRDNQSRVLPFIAKNRHYRVEPKTARIKVGTGTVLISTLVIASQVP